MRQLYLSKQGIRRRLDGPISDCKSVDVLPRDYYLKFSKVWVNFLKFKLEFGRGKYCM